MREQIPWVSLKTKMKHSIYFKYGSNWKLIDQLILEKKIEEIPYFRPTEHTVIIFRPAGREEDYKKLKKKYSVYSHLRTETI